MTNESARLVLAHQLRYLREMAGTSLSAVAKDLGKSVGHLSNVERGRDAPSHEIIAYYEDHFQGDDQLWSAWENLRAGRRPPQRARPGEQPDYPIPGDASLFVADVTVPDGTVLPPHFTFEKIWRIKNDGTVPWIGRRLARVGAAAGYGVLHSPSHVPIDDTMPGETVDIAVTLRTHPLPGTSQALWKMVDENGWEYFPDRYPGGLFTTIVVQKGAPPPTLKRLD